MATKVLRSTSTGCRHCVSCKRLTSCRETTTATMELWPASLQSPTVYYMLRVRQMAYDVKSHASRGPAAWRQHSVVGDAPSQLLHRRGLPQLSLNVPLAAGYGIKLSERAVYVRTVDHAMAAWLAQSEKPQSEQPAAAPLGREKSLRMMASASGSASPSAAPQRTPTLRFAARPPQQRAEEQAPKRRQLLPRASGHLIAAASSPCSVAIAMPSAAPSTCSSSSMSLTPTTSASSSSSFSSSAASSPLVAFYYKVKELLSPVPQQLGLAAA